MEATVITQPKSKYGRRLTDNQKVELVIQKEVRPTQDCTNVNLAQRFDCSMKTVASANYDSLTPEQKHLYQQRIQQLRYDAINVTSKAVRKMAELIDKADSPSHLGPVTNAFGKAYEVYRTEENLPSPDANAALIASVINSVIATQSKLHRAYPHQEEAPSKLKALDDYRVLCAKEGVQPDESLIDFSLLDGVENP